MVSICELCLLGNKKNAKPEFGAVVPIDAPSFIANSSVPLRSSGSMRLHISDLQYALKVGSMLNINDVDIIGMTTLMRFARRPKAEKIVEALLIHRANIDTKDVFGNTASVPLLQLVYTTTKSVHFLYTRSPLR